MLNFIIISIAVPFIISYLAGFAVRNLSLQYNFVDKPNLAELEQGKNHKTHTAVTPLGGGASFFAAIVLSIIGVYLAGCFPDVFVPFLPGNIAELLQRHADGILDSMGKPFFLLCMCGILFSLGLLDDLRGLSWQFRLLVEFAVATVTVCMGWRVSLFLGDSPVMIILTGVISVFWIVGLMNSFNMLDNMDGLSSGVGAICALFLAAFVLTQPESGDEVQWFVGGLFLILSGSLLGFLMHNKPPAKMFMGDCGSYLIGYLLSTISLSAVFAGENASKQAILAPLCVLAIPLYDTFSVIILRLRKGKSPFVGDANHLSHRLVRLGLSRPSAVRTIYCMTCACSVGALILPKSNLYLSVAVAAFTVGIIASIGFFEWARSK